MKVTKIAFLIRFLVGDMCSRWRENPFNPVAKFAVAWVMTLVATIILMSFYYAEVVLEQRLSRTGVHEIVVRETYQTVDKALPFIEHLRHLNGWTVHTVHALRGSVQTELGHRPKLYSWGVPNTLGSFPEVPLLYAERLKAGTRVRIWLNGEEMLVEAGAWESWMSRLGGRSLLIVPTGFGAESAVPFYEVTSVVMSQSDADVLYLSERLHEMMGIEDRNRVRIFDAADLLRELEALRANQVYWRWGILLGLGGTITLVIGVISLMEYKQWEYLSALLRSLGASKFLIYWRYLFDSTFAVAFAAGTAFACVLLFENQIFPIFGVNDSVLDILDLAAFLNAEGGVLSGFLFCGVILGTLPIAWLLRRPIGEVLG